MTKIDPEEEEEDEEGNVQGSSPTKKNAHMGSNNVITPSKQQQQQQNMVAPMYSQDPVQQKILLQQLKHQQNRHQRAEADAHNVGHYDGMANSDNLVLDPSTGMMIPMGGISDPKVK